MNPFDYTFNLNPYAYGYIATLGILFLSGIFILLNYILFGRRKSMLYAFLTLLTTLGYIFVFLLLINASNAEDTFRYTQLLYLNLMVLYNLSILMIRIIAGRSLKWFQMIGLISMVVLSGIMYGSDKLIITRELIASEYTKAGKGPMFFLLFIYILALTLYTLVDFYRFYRQDRNRFNIMWPLYAGITAFSFLMMGFNIIILIDPSAVPHLYLPALMYDFLLILYVFRQIRNNIDEHNRLYQNYLFDPLTQVHTRDYILQNLSDLMMNRISIRTYVAAIDLDGFKNINDTYGHARGDEVLVILGNLLSNLPQTDYLAGRLGGDEFMLIIQDRSLHKIEMELKSLIIEYTVKLTKAGVDVLECKTGLSIGVSSVSGDKTLEENLYQADQRMYQAKKGGKNNVVIEGMND